MFSCNENHIICQTHIIPDLNRITNALKSYDDIMFETRHSNKDYIDARRLLMVYEFDNCVYNDQKITVVNNCITKDSFRICPLCDCEKSIKHIHNEIYQRHNCNDEREKKIIDALLALGFNLQQICMVRNELNGDSLYDTDLIAAMILSQPPNEAQNGSQIGTVSLPDPTAPPLPQPKIDRQLQSDVPYMLVNSIRFSLFDPVTAKFILLKCEANTSSTTVFGLMMDKLFGNRHDMGDYTAYVEYPHSHNTTDGLIANEFKSNEIPFDSGLWSIPLQFHNRVGETLSHHVKEYVLLNDIKPKERVIFRSNKHNVGPKKEMRLLTQSYKNNNSMYQKFDSLCRTYFGWRSIRGDGNCYYRAIYFGLLEQIINLNAQHRVDPINDIIKTFNKAISFLNGEELQLANAVIQRLGECAGTSVLYDNYYYYIIYFILHTRLMVE
jgi:hypothetical protein